MLSNRFRFEDYSQKFYSYNNQERFYEVLRQHNQLQNVLLKRSSLQELQSQSKNYKNMIVLSILTSTLAALVFNKSVNFGPGLTPRVLKVTAAAVICTAPVGFVWYRAKQELIQVKKRIFEENRPWFRKYELTGDVLQTKNAFEIVQ